MPIAVPFRSAMLVQVGLAALAGGLIASAATAQAAPEPTSASPMSTVPGAPQATSEDGPEVVVTGTRIARSGYSAPTPLTVISQAEMLAQSPSSNVADFVNQIPSVSGSTRPSNSNGNISAGTFGVNALNLRSLGTARTLVLLDGRRSVGSTITGAVDVNDFPQGLIKSIEVVTGGASAAYGSDAVSGVVNFVLDKTYTGLKGSFEGNGTTRWDDPGWHGTLTAGLKFADDRGHILLNGELSKDYGLFGVPRSWNNKGNYIITNPAYAAGNGQPERILATGAGLSNATRGGIITSGPLRGTTFGAGGALGTFNYGRTLDPWMIGGDWQSVQVNNSQALDPADERRGAFGRASFKFSDAIELYGEASYNWDHGLGWTGVQLNQANVTIQSDNAYIPAALRTQLNSLNIRSFTLGTTNADLPIRKVDNTRSVQRYVIGGGGKFDLLGRAIKWDAFGQHGVTQTHEVAGDITNNARLALAQDAVTVTAANVGASGLALGSIACRSTLSSPSNGCVPLNRLGIGVASQAALNYVLGSPYRDETFKQDVAAANISFDAFRDWAGPVSIAMGVEHRREAVSGSVPTAFQSGWFVGNYLPSFGHYSVTEGYLEAVVPLAKGLDLNGAVRGTDYSTSGYVTTWKVGATFMPIPDIKLRATRSRDIRAPNLSELFQAGASRTNTLIDPFNGNTSVQFLEISTGNRNLTPEVADTTGVGVVLQPRFIPGLAFSVDFYDIKLDDAIGSTNSQVIIDRCYQGQTVYCAAIDRSTGQLRVSLSPFNFSRLHAQGIDFDLTYRVPLGDWTGLPGVLTFRGIATNYIKNRVNNGIDAPVDTAGQNSSGLALFEGPPNWIYRTSLTYDLNPWSFTVVGRGVSAGTLDNSYVQCTSGCAASTASHRTIDNNRIAGAFYVDLSISHQFSVGPVNGELFFHIANLFDRDPEIVPYGPAGSAYALPSTNGNLYDTLGRVIRGGLRFALR
jgi:outer membrane receptor protein involved in Fe transport